jgi:hypothetical protein
MASLPLAMGQDEEAPVSESSGEAPSTESSNFTDTEHVEEDNSTSYPTQSGPMRFHMDNIEPEAGPQTGNIY